MTIRVHVHARRLVLLLASLAAGAAAAAGPPLPQRNLSVEARLVESSALQQQSAGAGGSLVVGTAGASTVTGGVTLRAGSDRVDADGVQRVLVLNGARATVRLAQLTPLRSVEWLWTGRGAGHGLGGGAGVAERTVWVDVGRGLAVRPSWPGGRAPVRVEVAIESVRRGDTADPAVTVAEATAPRTAVQTEVLLPLGEWVTVAQLADDAAASGSAGGVGVSTRQLRREQSLQLRVTAP